MTVPNLLREGIVRARGHLRLIIVVYLLELGASLVLALAAAHSFVAFYSDRTLFARGVDGDLVALWLALWPARTGVVALFFAGLALLAAWKLASFYLGAGLAGALAGRGFAPTAAARFGGFVRLSIASLLPYAAAALVAALGLRQARLRLEDLKAWDTLAGIPLAAVAPGALLWMLTACAVDYGRAGLVLGGGELGAVRALLRGFRRVCTRPAALAHYLLYLLVWAGLSALYVAATLGRDFPGAAGAWLLFAMRQATAGARFLARTVTTGGQIADLDASAALSPDEQPLPAGGHTGGAALPPL